MEALPVSDSTGITLSADKAEIIHALRKSNRFCGLVCNHSSNQGIGIDKTSSKTTSLVIYFISLILY